MARRKKRKGGMGAQVAKNNKEAGRYGSTSIKLPEGVESFQLQEGMNLMNMVPYIVNNANHPDKISKGEQWYKRPFAIHANVGPNDDQVVCLAKTFGKACPICEDYKKLAAELGYKHPDTKALKPKMRNLYNILVEKDGKQAIQIFDVSDFLFQAVLTEEMNNGEDDYLYFAELEKGYTLKARAKKDSYDGREFLKTTRIDFEEREDLDEGSLGVDLDTVLVQMSYDEIKALFHGTEEEEPEPGDDVAEDDGSEPDNSSEDAEDTGTEDNGVEETPTCQFDGFVYGESYTEGDPDCEGCGNKAGCSGEEVEPEEEPEPEPEPESETPVCPFEESGYTYAESFSKGDEDCAACELKVGCSGVAVMATEPEPEPEPEEDPVCPFADSGFVFGESYTAGDDDCEGCAIKAGCSGNKAEPEKKAPEKAKKKTVAGAEGTCPHGRVFGQDTDVKKDGEANPPCEDCDLWVSCDDTKFAAK